MGQVLVGVIHNAVKFTPPGGTIAVRADTDGDGVRLSVSDSGIGMTAEELPRIFERFYKASQRAPGHAPAAPPVAGTGLGLAIAKHTVQLHGGTIWAESKGPGRGTTIHIRLPYQQANAPGLNGTSASASTI